MAKIRKLYDEAIKPDGNKQVIYPITSTRAVYTTTNVTVDTILNEGYRFGGVVLPNDTPEFTNQRVFYAASVPGHYNAFGGINVDGGEAIFLLWDGEHWSKGIFGGAGSNNLTGFKSLTSISELPLEETTIGYLIEDDTLPEGFPKQVLYVWVGENGDTLGGLYQNCGQLRGASAYESAVRCGYEGTVEEWLNDPVHGIKGNGIQSMSIVGEYSSEDSATNTYRITPYIGDPFDFDVKNGKGITSVEVVGTPSIAQSAINTYRITMSDNTIFNFQVKNGTGITSITETPSVANGGTNVIHIALSDGTSYDFEVKNGSASDGFFATESLLTTAIPSPNVGDYAFVSKAADGTFPAYIYVCTTAGTWTNSGQEFTTTVPQVSVSQNISTGHTDINIGGTAYPVASVEEVSQLGQNVDDLEQTSDDVIEVLGLIPSSRNLFNQGESENTQLFATSNGQTYEVVYGPSMGLNITSYVVEVTPSNTLSIDGKTSGNRFFIYTFDHYPAVGDEPINVYAESATSASIQLGNNESYVLLYVDANGGDVDLSGMRVYYGSEWVQDPSSAVLTTLQGKVSALETAVGTSDDVPTTESNNLVKSGGTYSAIRKLGVLQYYQELIQKVSTAESTETVNINAGQIILLDGSLSNISSTFGVTDLIEGPASSGKVVVVTPSNAINNLTGSYATIAYYYKFNNAYKLLYADQGVISGIIVVPMDFAVRISGSVSDLGTITKQVTSVPYTLSTEGLIKLSEEENLQYQSTQYNALAKIIGDNIGDMIPASSKTTGKYINIYGTISSIGDANWMVYVYDVTSLRGKTVYLSTPNTTPGTNMVKYGFSSVDSSVDKLPISHKISAYNETENYIFIPDIADLNYLLVTVYALGSLFATNDNETELKQGVELPADETISGKYLSPDGTVQTIAAEAFKLCFYDIENYVSQKVYIKGQTSSSILWCNFGLANTTDAESVIPLHTSDGTYDLADYYDVYPGNYKYLVVSQNTGVDSLRAFAVNPIEKNDAFIMDCDVLICPVYGQSLAVGGEAYPVVTKKIKYPKLQINADLTTMSLPATTETANYGFSEGMIEYYAKYYGISVSQIKTKIYSFVSGAGSTSIMSLKKGTDLYNTFIGQITTAYTNAVNAGLTCKVSPIAWIQGEHDLYNSFTNDWKGEVQQLQADLDADIRAITGQSETIKLMLYQTSFGAKDGYPDVLKAQTELIQDSTKFLALMPTYMMDFYHGSGDPIHINGYGQKTMGFYCAKAVISNMFGFATKGVSPVTITVSGDTATITANTESNALYFDDTYVRKANNFGFSVLNGSSNEVLQSVSVFANKIVLKCSQNIESGFKIRYGIANGETISGVNESGRTDGARGNIRDNDCKYIAEIGEYNIPLYNWMYAFENIVS